MPGGMGGMGGMGGGLMGALMKGGMNQNPSNAQAAQDIVDDYDVARWQRADGLDAAPTMVQTVRADWERKNSEKQERSPLKKFFNKFTRKKDTKPALSGEPEPRPAGGTIVTPEMKKASQRINPAAEQDIPVRQAEPPKRRELHRDAGGKNYLGLSFRSGIEGFFTANPVNSAFLAVDSLGMEGLALNQIAAAPELTASFERMGPDEQVSPDGQAGQDSATQRTETAYMDEFHKGREQRKYNVRISN